MHTDIHRRPLNRARFLAHLQSLLACSLVILQPLHAQQHVEAFAAASHAAPSDEAAVSADSSISLPPPIARQSLTDAWWTGPILAASANTLPRGHILIEPYVYDVIGTHSSELGSLTYALYGLTDKLTVGTVPTGGFNRVSDGLSSSTIELGDVPVQAQYRLTQFHPGSWIPTSSINVSESFPTGQYDRLGNHPSDGLGSGAFTTTLASYSQMYLWLPNRRILRTRFDVSEALSSNVTVQDVSVYNTTAGFSGHASPGNSFFADSSWEYSVTRRWVVATDLTYRHTANTRVTGTNGTSSITLNSGSSDAFGFAPAVEYSWKSTIGIIFGTRVIPASHNTNATITPVMAINFVH